MFEEQRIKWEGGRGFRICEYWLESGIVETNHKPKAQNRKVGLTESLSEWCHKEGLDLQICCVVCFCLLGALAAPRTATIPLSQVLQLFSHQEPTGGASTWMAQLDLFHRVFWWRRGTGSRFLNVSMGWARVSRILETQALCLHLQQFTAPVSQSNPQSTLNPFQNTENLSHPASPLPFPHRITQSSLKKKPNKILKPEIKPKTTAVYKRHFKNKNWLQAGLCSVAWGM